MSNKTLDGIMGLCVGDALGIPVEFESREDLLNNPVTDMRSYGTYNQPLGTWSDDTSLTLCLLDSLNYGLDYYDIMSRFKNWYTKGEYTPFGEVFDVGIGTRKAIKNFIAGVNPLECGAVDEGNNGNGALMRILPLAFSECDIDTVHKVCSLTHGHLRSKVACGIYVLLARKLMNCSNLQRGVSEGLKDGLKYYLSNSMYHEEIKNFSRLFYTDFKNIPMEDISSTGYVVDTLESAIWALLNSNSYEDCVLTAVNLGEDCDTIGALAGGLAGIYYGFDKIPKKWVNSIVKKDYIINLCYKGSVRRITVFIPLFERGEELYKYKEGNLIYDDRLLAFIDEVYTANLVNPNYLEVIKRHKLISRSEINNSIETASLELTLAILAGYLRQERFSDGIWAQAVDDRTFLRILRRLKDVVND